MLVKDYMTKHPLLVSPTMSIVEAQRFMGENSVRHLPVTEKGKRLLGLVTRQTLLLQPATLSSLNVWEITRFLSNLTVGDVMVKNVITAEKDSTIEEAACIMVENKIGCLPVLEDGVVIGIITEIDLLAQLMEMMATRVPGVRVTVRMP
ncbi:MAG: CBS domain-containing protein, partial [Chloroflexota bacterium]